MQILLTFSKTYADCGEVLALIIFQQDLYRKKVKMYILGIYSHNLFKTYISGPDF